ncbi:MAG: phosphatase PAP2 family protein [Deltaproteobacteria bacterium]|nr:phosphatase PAP2 family protein [Deltaproteobacteria bacterium]
MLHRELAIVINISLMAAIMYFGWDYSLRLLLEDFGNSDMGKAWGKAAYWMGHGGVQLALGAILMANGFQLGRFKRVKAGIYSIWAVSISGVAVQVVKYLAGRARPRMNLQADMWFGLSFNSDMHSFPSGHTATSFALAAWLAYRYPHMAVVFYGMATFVAVGRVISGAHFPSDILAGAVLGMLVGSVLALWSERKRQAS